ncbi:hypothetical protein HT136_01255 [Novosphingobium profundi]|uniref:crAss001_48 related protein n=1 Tax=Novosphingobium profundi TaxID=1774954 RepID=UPI001BDAFBDC|nr:hypothetical protein [Novosphingobium profundi]MBT0666993.1 hypothetical protein [Novosphingobium profundi]
MSAPHIERMIEEADQLSGRIEKLGAFLAGQIYPLLPEEEQTLLSAQCGAMTAYLQILTLRVSRATGVPL